MGGTQVFLKAGEIFTLDELMKAALVESANDAAYAVAEYAAGSSDEFVKLMNAKAQALGMLDTEFHCVARSSARQGRRRQHQHLQRHDPVGARSPPAPADHRVDLHRAARPSAAARSSISNKNKLVGRVPGVDGLKTGYTRKAGFNIVATAKTGDRRLIVVVLGSPESRIRNGFATEKFREHLLVRPAEPWPGRDRPSPAEDLRRIIG